MSVQTKTMSRGKGASGIIGSAEPLARLHGIERTFPQGADRLHALRRVDLEITRGEWISVMGPSGAGKSTLLAVLGLQDFGWTGRYWLAGEPVHELDVERRAHLRGHAIGFVFQSYHLLDDHSVFENLEVPLAYQDLPKRERIARVSETLDRFGLAARRDLLPRQLSGGQQQLVAIARALVSRPRLLLADEPTGSLHSDQADEVMRLSSLSLGERRSSVGESEDRIVRLPPNGVSLKAIEREALLQALQRTYWVQKDAAAHLDISPRVMHYKLKTHGITPPRRSPRR